MSSGAPAVQPSDARKAKLGLGLAAFEVEGGAGVRAQLTRSAAAEAVRAAARCGLRRFEGAEGCEPLLADAGGCSLTVTLSPSALGPDQIEGRVAMALDRLVGLLPLTVLLPGARLLAEDGDELWATFSALSGQVRCGVAVDSGGDALGLARRFKPEVMQVSTGLLDQRLILSGSLGEIAALGIELQLRTSLLRGLLFLPREGLPAALADAGPQVSRVRRMIAEAGVDPLQAALAFALDRPEASSVIVEAGSAGEVRALVAAASAPSPQLDWPRLALDHPAALDAEARLRHRAAA